MVRSLGIRSRCWCCMSGDEMRDEFLLDPVLATVCEARHPRRGAPLSVYSEHSEMPNPIGWRWTMETLPPRREPSGESPSRVSRRVVCRHCRMRDVASAASRRVGAALVEPGARRKSDRAAKEGHTRRGAASRSGRRFAFCKPSVRLSYTKDFPSRYRAYRRGGGRPFRRSFNDFF